jgi:transcriptional regulator with XRE-family HTH domain
MTDNDSVRSPRIRRSPASVRRALRQLSDDVVTWRKLRGLTQAQLAARADVSVNTVRRFEDGDGGLSTENLLRILRAVGVLDAVHHALDPYESDVGRLRSDERLPRRVRPRDLTGKGDG